MVPVEPVRKTCDVKLFRTSAFSIAAGSGANAAQRQRGCTEPRYSPIEMPIVCRTRRAPCPASIVYRMAFRDATNRRRFLHAFGAAGAPAHLDQARRRPNVLFILGMSGARNPWALSNGEPNVRPPLCSTVSPARPSASTQRSPALPSAAFIGPAS